MNLTLEHIDALYTRRLQVKDVAALLNVRPNALSVHLSREGFKIPPSEKLAARKAAHNARTIRSVELKLAALKVQKKQLTLEQAAASLNCHPRTILRHGPR